MPGRLPVRPTTDVAKEGLFNILNNRIDYEETKVLDLFSGTGGISFEFASRGCKTILAVDQNVKCTGFISEFSKKMDFDNIRVLRSDAIRFLERGAEKYDLIFADPPFDFQHHRRIVDLVLQNDLLEKKGILIIEHSSKDRLNDFPNFLENRKYGHVMFSFFGENDEE